MFYSVVVEFYISKVWKKEESGNKQTWKLGFKAGEGEGGTVVESVWGSNA